MKGENEMEGMLEILLSVPGMKDNVKAGLNLSRKQVLLLANVIGEGITVKGGMVEQLLKVMPEESRSTLQAMADELMEKAELTDLHNKIKQFKS